MQERIEVNKDKVRKANRQKELLGHKHFKTHIKEVEDREQEKTIR